MKVSLQLYTVRKFAKKDLYGTLKRINSIGYKSIEAARIKFNNKSASIINKAQADFGLEVLSCLIEFKYLLNDFATIVSWLHKVNCSNVVVSFLPLRYFLKGEKGIIQFAKKLNELAEKYQQEGIKFSYHHHDIEFLKFNNRRGIDILLSELNKDLVYIECDTYWLQKGGACPASFIKNLKGRIISIHLKDYYLVQKGIKVIAKDCAVGSGMLDIIEILKACIEADVKYIFVEQDSSNSFVDIKSSLEYINPIINKEIKR